MNLGMDKVPPLTDIICAVFLLIMYWLKSAINTPAYTAQMTKIVQFVERDPVLDVRYIMKRAVLAHNVVRSGLIVYLEFSRQAAVKLVMFFSRLAASLRESRNAAD
jgi:hypothetical protein